MEDVDQGRGVESRACHDVRRVAKLKGHAACQAGLRHPPPGQLQHLPGRVDPVQAKVRPRALEGDQLDPRAGADHEYAPARREIRLDDRGEHREEGAVSRNDLPGEGLVTLPVVTVEVEDVVAGARSRVLLLRRLHRRVWEPCAFSARTAAFAREAGMGHFVRLENKDGRASGSARRPRGSAPNGFTKNGAFPPIQS